MLYPGRSLDPSEIEMLSRVSRLVCKESGLPLASPEAERMASHLLKLFMNGLTSEEELLDAENNRLKAAPRITTSAKAAVLQDILADCLPYGRQEVA